MTLTHPSTPASGSGVSRTTDQQRIANLIAVRALMVSSASAFPDVGRAGLEAQIVEGLGLSRPSSQPLREGQR